MVEHITERDTSIPSHSIHSQSIDGCGWVVTKSPLLPDLIANFSSQEKTQHQCHSSKVFRDTLR